MIQKKEVTGSKAFKYLAEQLSLGGKTLSNCINLLPIQGGKIYAFVPENTLEEQLFNFEAGGIYPNNMKLSKTANLIPIPNEARPVLINIISNYLSITEENCCIFEESNAKPSDPWISKSKIEYVYKDEEIFYFFDEKNANNILLERAIRVSDGYYFLFALGSINIEDHVRFTPFAAIKFELLKIFSERINSFFVKAYDGEGYLMWTNN